MESLSDAVMSVVEMLERRTMMSATVHTAAPKAAPPPMTISYVAIGSTEELQIHGGATSNNINVNQTTAGLLVSDNGVSQTVTGVFAEVKIFGGAGNDSIIVDASVTTDCFLYGGGGVNTLQAGTGNDTLDCIGSTADTLTGGMGNDSFWIGASAKVKTVNVRSDEIAGGNVHTVGAFYTPPGVNTGTAVLPEPAMTTGAKYANFSNQPLFASTGPSENDIRQGQVGDCYFLAVLSSVAKIDPNKIRQSILDMGDGTYLVQFTKGKANYYLHIDGQLPVFSNGQLEYAQLGTGNSTWVALMEKAFADFRTSRPSYASISGGWMDEVYSDLGDSSKTTTGGGAAALMAAIKADLAAGQSVTIGINAPKDGAPLIGSHAYTLDSIVLDNKGNAVALVVRNPWGVDGAGNDGHNDGYVTITAQQAYDSMYGICAANV